ncbi:MAG: dTDP-4-dehydrorhamnose reductase [Desulfotignum sp.]|nr:dTDP-4-dehydrorhamnose reductase [Desulfotignum sp.]
MKVLIIGANGQLGSELLQTCPTETRAFGMDVPEIDITNSIQVDRVLEAHAPDWVINCAAYTQVDKAESDAGAAHAVNCTGAANLARAIKKTRARLVLISTDFVFGGDQSRPYKPDDRPDPKSVYGKTKLAGEQAVSEILGIDALIIRTAWLYAAHGNNFVKTMIRLMKEKEVLTVVDDQVGTPCWAKGLAQAVWAAIEKKLTGVFHWTDAGVASWYDFAVAVQEEALAAGLLNRTIQVLPIPGRQYPTPAHRPDFSVLDKSDLVAAIGISPEHWRRQLRRMLQEL